MSAPTLYGVTSPLGGSELAAAGCFTTTCTVTGAAVGMPVQVTPRTFPGNGAFWAGYVSAPNVVTVKLCNAEAGTLDASIFDVAVFNSGGTFPATLELETDGTPNDLQTLLNLISGTNVTLTPDGAGGVTIEAAGASAAPTAQSTTTGHAPGNVYQNTNPTPLWVLATFDTGTDPVIARTDASNPPTTIVGYQNNIVAGSGQCILFPVLAGNFYKIDSPTPTLNVWTEWH